MALVQFRTGTLAQYLASEKNANTLYFLTDTGQLYKGDTLYSGAHIRVTEFPAEGEAVANSVYVNTTTGEVRYYSNNTNYTQMVKPVATTITDAADHTTIPTTKAVYDYLQGQINDLDVGQLAGRVSAVETSVTAAQEDINTLNGGVSVTGSVANTVQTEIEKLDSSIAAEAGKAITSVTVVDGKITAHTKESFDAAGAAAAVLGTATDTADANTVYGAKAAAAAAATAASAAQSDVDDLEEYVGDLPAGVEGSVVDYIDAKAAAAIYDDTALATRVSAAETAIDTLNGGASVTGSVANQVNNAVVSLVDGAPDSLDTLKEIADWIANDPTGSTSLVASVQNLQNYVGTIPTEGITATTVVDYIKEQDDALDARIDDLEASVGAGVSEQITAAIKNLDSTITASAGYAITGITITDGLLTGIEQAQFDAAGAAAAAQTAAVSAANSYTDSKIANAKAELIGEATDTAAADTIYGAKAAASAAATAASAAQTAASAAQTTADAAQDDVDALEALVGNTSVADQISDAITAAATAAASTATAPAGSVLQSVIQGTDGKITAGQTVTLAAVATSGAASDVSIVDSGNLITATNVESALQEIANVLSWQSII